MFRKQVQPLSELLKEFLRSQGLETPLLEKRLMDSWDSVSGRMVARLSGERFIKNKTLFVKISNPALRNELTMMRQELIKKLNQQVGSVVITEIRFF